MPGAQMIKGVIHGKTIELERAPGLPEGQAVTVAIEPLVGAARLAPGEGIASSAGAWSDAGAELDEWLAEIQRSRQQDRRGVP